MLVWAGLALWTARGQAPAPAPGRQLPAPRCIMPAGAAGERLLLSEVPIDLNRATPAELEALPGVGPQLAARILGARPLCRLGDLAAVPGVGARRVEKLSPYVSATCP